MENEYELIEGALQNIIMRNPEFNPSGRYLTLTNRIAAVHVVYRDTSESTHWFGQLTSHYPEILAGMRLAAAEKEVKDLTDVQAQQKMATRAETPGSKDMMLHLYAVERVLDRLKPPLQPSRQSQYSDHDILNQWLQRLQRVGNIIESILSLQSGHTTAITAR
jgi:hypothetical protein